jgi:hypothetical protein
MNVNAQVRHLEFNEPATGLFHKNGLQGEVLIGVELNDFISIEGGYFQTPRKTMQAVVVQGDNYFGGVLGLGPSRLNPNTASFGLVNKIETRNKSRIYGFRISAKLNCWVDELLNLTLSMGVSQTKLRLSHTILTYSTTDGFFEMPTASNAQLNFEGNKVIPMVGVGGEYSIANDLAFRANIQWEQTNRFRNLTPAQENIRPGQSIVSARNSILYGIGLYYKF